MEARMPGKQRGVFERPDGSGVWWICYYDAEGKRHREKVGRYKTAVETYYSRKAAIREGRFEAPRPPAGVSFRELAAEAQAERKTRLAAFSWSSDEQRLAVWVERFGDQPAAKITASMVSEVLQEMREEGSSGATSNRYRAVLSAIFAWGAKHRKVAANPAREVEAARESDPVVRFLEEDEEASLRRVLREEYPEREAELDVALHTGMRRNELYRLTWDKVDLKRHIVTVQGKAHARSRLSSQRRIPLNARAKAAFLELYARSNGSAFVCPGAHDGTETDRDGRDWFERSVARAGIINFRYHDLRHTFASRLVMAGVSLASVMEYLGHRSMAMTLRYAHLAPDHQRANIERLVTAYPARAEGETAVVEMAVAGGRRQGRGREGDEPAGIGGGDGKGRLPNIARRRRGRHPSGGRGRDAVFFYRESL
jgi:integrase